MKREESDIHIVDSIAQMHRNLRLPKPEHPLISVVRYEDIMPEYVESGSKLVHRYYMICIKKGFKGKMKYGRQYYDFDDGILSFIAPGQIIVPPSTEDCPVEGWMLSVHPDFLRSHPLGNAIKEFGFFSYQSNEALHMSEKEEAVIEAIISNIEGEYKSVVDLYSQKLIVSHIELLLTYADRFYNRQFITRKQANPDLLISFENILSDYFKNDEAHKGLPTVQYIADHLHLSAGYVSDMLRTLTGQNAQQHIHNYVIEKAKDVLATTTLSVNEIAYQLGFEYPQYFSRLFKTKTQVTPLEYRQSFN